MKRLVIQTTRVRHASSKVRWTATQEKEIPDIVNSNADRSIKN